VPFLASDCIRICSSRVASGCLLRFLGVDSGVVSAANGAVWELWFSEADVSKGAWPLSESKIGSGCVLAATLATTLTTSTRQL